MPEPYNGIQYLEEDPGKQLHVVGDRAVQVGQNQPAGMSASLSGPAPSYSSPTTTPAPRPQVTPPAGKGPEGHPKAPEQKMSHAEMMAWADRALGKLHAQEDAMRAGGPTIGPEGLRNRNVSLAVQNAKARPAPPTSQQSATAAGPATEVRNPTSFERNRQEPTGNGTPLGHEFSPGSKINDATYKALLVGLKNQPQVTGGIVNAAHRAGEAIGSAKKGVNDAAESMAAGEYQHKNPFVEHGMNLNGRLVGAIYDSAGERAIRFQRWLREHTPIGGIHGSLQKKVDRTYEEDPTYLGDVD